MNSFSFDQNPMNSFSFDQNPIKSFSFEQNPINSNNALPCTSQAPVPQNHNPKEFTSNSNFSLMIEQ